MTSFRNIGKEHGRWEKKTGRARAWVLGEPAKNGKAPRRQGARVQLKKSRSFLLATAAGAARAVGSRGRSSSRGGGTSSRGGSSSGDRSSSSSSRGDNGSGGADVSAGGQLEEGVPRPEKLMKLRGTGKGWYVIGDVPCGQLLPGEDQDAPGEPEGGMQERLPPEVAAVDPGGAFKGWAALRTAQHAHMVVHDVPTRSLQGDQLEEKSGQAGPTRGPCFQEDHEDVSHTLWHSIGQQTRLVG
ncbi:hypothetical protein DUNSADRAFT_2635 [Dunaliella salina]|uniref:Encoded protein n=1 Tax=Dunaliella salina TaxID=3046 RepID=A0ABQ7FW39_DUNSA|nr:hypothetical protein DUNSADRAFT_2635 [Dunaliella salina]|eukprot:KAF5826584.1 hypothetical protein DUNSADRAFT_2635 [Dunaliella salina]